MKVGRRRLALYGVCILAVAGCQVGEAAEDGTRSLFTVSAARGDLLIRAEATGQVEPVREVEVKSKASGEILQLYVDVGDDVERGTLLAEIDPRDVRNRYNQTQADLEVAQARMEISEAQLERSRQLFDAEVITQQDYESATLDFANQRANLVRAQTDFNLAELQLADVSIRAPMAGTIIQKNVEEGTVIQSASSNVSGGTALFVMADLGDMQVRTLVDETDMGRLEPGLETSVTVEAFPERTFRGLVEKIEPQAQVEQNVTMFPVIVSLDNSSRLLKPGMNAEVEIFIDEALDVVMVPNNAIVQTADVGPAAMALGLDVDDLDLSAFTRPTRSGRGGGTRAGGASGDAGARGGNPPQQGATGSTATQRAPGADAPAPEDARARIQALRAQAESGEISQDSLNAALRGLAGQAGFQRGSFGGRSGTGRSGGDGAATETRPAAVFVLGPDSIPQPRLVQLGVGDWDNTQVVSGIEAGETLVVVGAAQLQAQQQAFLDRMRGNMGGNPFGGAAPGRGLGGGRGR